MFTKFLRMVAKLKITMANHCGGSSSPTHCR